ncbi:caveolae-associated protein 4 [Petaurus breviceps papuanus]|uniref:caveolae-associated protein 4 n=1 Tax=Petaurus breviceps papuanus TaxID=3040969 RepID=UPI0036D9C466
MDHNKSTANADKIHQNRLSGVSVDEDQDAALTIVTVLDKVATIIDSVQESQKRIEERHRTMENTIKSVQIDMLKLSQAHSNTGYIVNKLFEKTRKVSANVKEIKARVEKHSLNVKKVETKQEEVLRKNKFRVVIFQEDVQCPTSLSVVKEKSLLENIQEDEFCLPDDLSSDEEYEIEESRAAQFKKSGKKQIDNIKKAFSKENMQRTRENFDKKVDRIRTRIVTPERRERIRQSGERLRQSGERLRQSGERLRQSSGERLKQSGERFKKTISKATPTKETFKMHLHKKGKGQTTAEGQEGIQDMGMDIFGSRGAQEPLNELYTEMTAIAENEQGREVYLSQAEEETQVPVENIDLQHKIKGSNDESLLLDLKQSA